MKTITDKCGIKFMPMTCSELANSLLKTPDEAVCIQTDIPADDGGWMHFAPVEIGRTIENREIEPAVRHSRVTIKAVEI